MWGRNGRGWRASDAPPPDDDLEPPHEVILPELPSYTYYSISTTFTSLRLSLASSWVSLNTHQFTFHYNLLRNYLTFNGCIELLRLRRQSNYQLLI